MWNYVIIAWKGTLCTWRMIYIIPRKTLVSQTICTMSHKEVPHIILSYYILKFFLFILPVYILMKFQPHQTAQDNWINIRLINMYLLVFFHKYYAAWYYKSGKRSWLQEPERTSQTLQFSVIP